MPSNLLMIDNSFPTFTGTEKPNEQIAQLTNYMRLLVEQLQYQLKNLDTTNWNKKAMQNFQADTTLEVEEELGKIAEELGSVRTRLTAVEKLTGRMSMAEEKIRNLETATEETEQRVAELEKGLDAARDDITALKQVVQVDGTGGAAIGAEGRDVHLVGNIYINGILFEGGAS